MCMLIVTCPFRISYLWQIPREHECSYQMYVSTLMNIYIMKVSVNQNMNIDTSIYFDNRKYSFKWSIFQPALLPECRYIHSLFSKRSITLNPQGLRTLRDPRDSRNFGGGKSSISPITVEVVATKTHPGTPPKTNMEHKAMEFWEDDFPLHFGADFQGTTIRPSQNFGGLGSRVNVSPFLFW